MRCICRNISELPVLSVDSIPNERGIRCVRPKSNGYDFSREAKLQPRRSTGKLASINVLKNRYPYDHQLMCLLSHRPLYDNSEASGGYVLKLYVEGSITVLG